MQASTEQKVFQIFRAGDHVAMSGLRCSFTVEDLQCTAEAYNLVRHRAPLVLGHSEGVDETYGFVEEVFVKEDALYVRAQVDSELIAMVRAGRIKDRSASFFSKKMVGNPCPGIYYLRHVGMLGAMPPAVKGMPSLGFGEKNPLLADIESHYFCAAEAKEIRSSNPLILDAESRSMGDKLKW